MTRIRGQHLTAVYPDPRVTGSQRVVVPRSSQHSNYVCTEADAHKHTKASDPRRDTHRRADGLVWRGWAECGLCAHIDVVRLAGIKELVRKILAVFVIDEHYAYVRQTVEGLRQARREMRCRLPVAVNGASEEGVSRVVRQAAVGRPV